VKKNLKEKNLNKIQHWIDSDQQMQLSYSDNTPYLIEKVLALYEELRKTGNYKNYTKLPIPLKRLKIA
jgi:phage-related protein